MSSTSRDHSRYKPRSPQMESGTEEARLDALIASPAAKLKPLALPSRVEPSSHRTKKAALEKSVMNSRLDQATRETQYSTSTRKEDRPSDAFVSSPRRPQRLPDKFSQGTQQKSPLKHEHRPSDLFSARPRRPGSSKSYQPSDALGSRPRCAENSHIKTAFTSAHDIHMASRQTQYETLAPQEKKKQEEWAQKKLKELGRCTAGFEWIRVPGGYNCSAGNHWMSDVLVTEGRGGYVYLKEDYHKGYDSPDYRAVADALQRDRRIGFRDGMDRFQAPVYDDKPLNTRNMPSIAEPWNSSLKSSNPWGV